MGLPFIWGAAAVGSGLAAGEAAFGQDDDAAKFDFKPSDAIQKQEAAAQVEANREITQPGVVRVIDGQILDESGVLLHETAIDIADANVWDQLRGTTPVQATIDTPMDITDHVVSDGTVINVNGKEIDRARILKDYGVTVMTGAEARAAGINAPSAGDGLVYTNMVPDGSQLKKMDSQVVASTDPVKDFSLLSKKRVNFETQRENDIETTTEGLKANSIQYQNLVTTRDEYDAVNVGGNISSNKKEFLAAMGKYDTAIKGMEAQFLNQATNTVTRTAEYKLTERNLIAEEAALTAQRKAMANLAKHSEGGKIVMQMTGLTDARQATLASTTGDAGKMTTRIQLNSNQPLPTYQDQGSETMNQWALRYAMVNSSGDPALVNEIGAKLFNIGAQAETDTIRHISELSLQVGDEEGKGKGIYAGMTPKEIKDVAGKQLYRERYRDLANSQITNILLSNVATAKLSPETATIFNNSLAATGRLDPQAFAGQFKQSVDLNKVANEFALLAEDVTMLANSTSIIRTAGANTGSINTQIAAFIDSLRTIQANKTGKWF